FGEYDAAVLLAGVAMNRAHQLALGGEWHFADTGQPFVENIGSQTGLPSGHQQGAFRRVALHDPSSLLFLHGGVVRPIGGCGGALEVPPEWAVERPAPGTPGRPPRGRA